MHKGRALGIVIFFSCTPASDGRFLFTGRWSAMDINLKWGHCLPSISYTPVFVKLGGVGLLLQASYRGGICNSNNAGFVGVPYKNF